jgi:bifunctional ADP-heptose synthase (sugar kinase/adenylyltransferase)
MYFSVISSKDHILLNSNLDNSSISDEILDEIISSITKTESDAVIFSDFRHGIFNKRTIKPLINSIPSGVFKVADSQVASRWGNILDFKGFDLITPNEREARFALADQDSGIRPLASQLYDNCDAGLLILKLGERGILTCLNGNHESLDSFIVMDSFAQHVVDPVGAGDALIAYSTLAMLATGNPIIASIIGNIAAGCECEHDGNIPIGVGEVKNKLDVIQKIINSST